MELVKPIYYSGIGKRKVNEDFLYPEYPNTENNLYMVCDGLGGMAYGELASKMTALAVQNYIDKVELYSKDVVASSIRFANNLIQEFSVEHPKTKGMSSTVAMLVQDEHDFFAGWVGDSRIYHIRDGEILFKSKDHSYKELLTSMGVEEDETKGMGHIITQAVGGKQNIRPGLARIGNIQIGDYLVLLTDGVLEGVPEAEFLSYFKSKNESETILEQIVNLCSEKSRDNHTLYILKTK
jgi:protein phosphatase